MLVLPVTKIMLTKALEYIGIHKPYTYIKLDCYVMLCSYKVIKLNRRCVVLISKCVVGCSDNSDYEIIVHI